MNERKTCILADLNYKILQKKMLKRISSLSNPLIEFAFNPSSGYKILLIVSCNSFKMLKPTFIFNQQVILSFLHSGVLIALISCDAVNRFFY